MSVSQGLAEIGGYVHLENLSHRPTLVPAERNSTRRIKGFFQDFKLVIEECFSVANLIILKSIELALNSKDLVVVLKDLAILLFLLWVFLRHSFQV